MTNTSAAPSIAEPVWPEPARVGASASTTNELAASAPSEPPLTRPAPPQPANPRTPGVEQRARLAAAVRYHSTIHHDPFSPPEMYPFMVGDVPCSIVIRNWRDRPSYDPNSLDLPNGVQIEDSTPDWDEVNYDTLRELLFATADGSAFTSVRWRLDW